MIDLGVPYLLDGPYEFDREQLAWAAGVFDGEGNTNTHLRKGSVGGRYAPDIRMAVSQYHASEVIERFGQAVLIGRIRGRVRANRHESAEFIWVASGFERVQAVAALLWPWLSVPKKQQIQTAISQWHSYRRELGIRV